MADDRIEIEIVLDDGSIQKGFATVRKEADKTSKSISKSFRRGLTRDISKPFDIAKKSVFNLRTAVVGLTAVLGGGAFLRTVTQAAAQQEEAVNALNVSLKTAGTFSEEASESFQKLASELQSQSTIGDEVILQQAALARNYARSNEEAEKLIKVSLDLAAATGTSLDSAVRNLGKTFSGLTGELGEAVPQVRGLTAEQLKAGAALDVLAARFGGSALGATKTFAGALQQLRNTFGDLLERIGETITGSPQVIAFFNALSVTFQELIKNLGGAGKGFDDFFKNLVINGAAAASALIESFSALSQIPTFIEFAFTQAQIAILKGLNFILSAIQPVAGLLDRVLGKTGESAGVIVANFQKIAELEGSLTGIAAEGVKIDQSFDLARKSLDTFTTTFQELSVATQGAGETTQSPISGVVDAVDKDLVLLKEKVAKLQTETQMAINQSFFNNEDVLAGTPSVFENLSNKGKDALETLQKSLTATRDKTLQLSAQIGQAVNNGIANTITNSISAAVKALQSGEDAFGAFAKAALATIGDLAVQLGQTLIASGIGIEALKVLGGAAAIAAGVALVAVGTLISSAAGGGASSPTGGSAVTPPLADLEPDGVSDSIQEQSAAVQVNIQGDVLDSDQTGLRLAELLRDEGFNNAVVS